MESDSKEEAHKVDEPSIKKDHDKHEHKTHHEHKSHVHKSHHQKSAKPMIWNQVISVILLIIISFQLSSLNAKFSDMQPQAAAQPTPAAAAPAPTPTAPTPQAAPVDMAGLIDDDIIKGDPDAPVTIVEWSDFECPFCARFYSQTLKQIDEQYIQTGKVKLVYRDFPLSFHPNAQKAAEASECAKDQDKFWEMHDKLFESGVSGGVASFKTYASELGLDQAKFDECLDSGTKAAEVRKDMADGQNAGVSGTPGFIVNGQLISGAQPFANFQRVIEAELAK